MAGLKCLRDYMASDPPKLLKKRDNFPYLSARAPYLDILRPENVGLSRGLIATSINSRFDSQNEQLAADLPSPDENELAFR